MWFLPTAQTPTHPWKVGRPVIPLASSGQPVSSLATQSRTNSEVLVTVKHTHTRHSGQRWPGPRVGEGWPQALISFCELAVSRLHSLCSVVGILHSGVCRGPLYSFILVPLGGLRGLLL